MSIQKNNLKAKKSKKKVKNVSIKLIKKEALTFLISQKKKYLLNVKIIINKKRKQFSKKL